MRADHLVAGEELRLRHQAAAARKAARARRHLRVRPADRRHRRRHPAGSAGRHARRAEDRRPGGRPPGRPQPRRGERASLDDPVLLALADVKRNFPVPMEAFGELIDGCVADVRGTRYETFEDLHHYCRCMAGSIGRLSLGIFGTGPDHTGHDQQEAARLADSLGVALQLTNILRDIREDHGTGGSTCPPRTWRSSTSTWTNPARLNSSGWWKSKPNGPANGPPQAGAAADARRRSAACTGAMAGIYRPLLERIAAQPAAVLDSRVLCPGRRKPWSRCAPWRGGSDEY